jgi:cell division protease FtsH
MAWLQPGSDKVHKVTIIPRGRALGLTAYLPQDERHSFSREYWLRVLTHLMGGRAAEHIVLNQLTTGAADDIRRATNIARRMVCEWGMSERLGPLTFGSKEEFVFLGREISQQRDYSEKTAIMIDEEVRSLVDGAYNHARQLLVDNEDKLHTLAMALLEREVLDGDQVERILNGEKLEPLPRHSSTDGQDQSGLAQPVDEEKESARGPKPRIAPTESPGLA